MPDADLPVTIEREAVGIFDDSHRMQEAIDELMSSGFARCQISLAGRQTGDQRDETALALSDDPAAVRVSECAPEVFGDAEGSLIGGFAIVPAMGAGWAAAAAGLGVAAGAGLAVASGGTGLLIGLGAAALVARHHRAGTEQHAQLLWVRTRTAEMEARAHVILARHAAHDIHSHDLLPLV